MRHAVAFALLWAVGMAAQAQQVAFAPARSWALVVGATDYPKLPPLKYADRDAKRISDTLIGSFGFDERTVTLLNSHEHGTKEPTRVNILASLNRLIGDPNLSRGDLFVFYFSGHGLATPKGDYLCPVDVDPAKVETQGIAVRDLVERIVNAGLKNVLIVTDACREGTRTRFGTELAELGKRTNLAVLMGCLPGEKSYEYPQLQSGAFTYTLARALNDAKSSDPASGAVWASAVARQVAVDVRDRTARDYGAQAQVPYVFSERAQDVLLGVRWKKADGFYASFKAEANEVGKINRRLLSQMLLRAGVQAGVTGDFARSVEMLATLERLGEADPIARLCLGLGYVVTAQMTEANRVLDALAIDKSAGIYQLMAKRYSVSGRFSDQERAEAAKAIFLNNPSDEEAYNYWMFVTSRELSRSMPAIEREIRAAMPSSALFIQYLDTRQACQNGTFLEGLKAANRALATLKAKYSKDVHDLLLQELYLLYRKNHDDARAQKMVEIGLKLNVSPGFWNSQKQAAEKDDELKAVFEEYDKSESVEEKLLVIRKNGHLASKLLDRATAQRGKYPTSYAAIMGQLICQQAGDWTHSVRLNEAAVRYARSPLDAALRWADVADSVVEGAALEGQVSPVDRARLQTEIVALVWPHLADVAKAPTGNDVIYWSILDRVLMDRQDPHTFLWVARKYALPTLNEKSSYAQIQFVMDAAVQAKDEALLRRVAVLKVVDSEYLVPPRVRLALFLAMVNRYEESKAVLKDFPTLADRTSQSYVTALNLLNRCATEPRSPELMTAVMSSLAASPDDIVSLSLIVRCTDFVLLENYMPAKPGLPDEHEQEKVELINKFLNSGETSMMPKFPDVTAWIVRLPLVVNAQLVSREKVNPDSFRPFLSWLFVNDQHLSTVTLGGSTKPADFVGTYRFSGHGFTRDAAGAGAVEIVVDNAGGFKATITRTTSSGNETVKLSGSVSASGILSATGFSARLVASSQFALLPGIEKTPWQCRMKVGEADSWVFVADQSVPKARG
jgi:uncharacterized caspase-like protein/thioredoxin-like negative regulator of GroEL